MPCPKNGWNNNILKTVENTPAGMEINILFASVPDLVARSVDEAGAIRSNGLKYLKHMKTLAGLAMRTASKENNNRIFEIKWSACPSF